MSLCRAAAIAAVLAAAVAGTALASASKPAIVGNVKVGKQIFKLQQCGSCHMLAASGDMDSSGVGPDLDTIKATYARMVTQITKGGHGMTPYKGILTTVQIQDVAAFVYTSAHAK